jgi:RNA polymerase sigma-70 factor (ECF subfamily)
MGDPSGTGQEGLERSRSGSVMTAPEVELWFVSEVLPLESVLTQFLRHNWRDANDIEDLRQEVYVRVCEGAQKQIPEATKPFVLTIARNLLIDKVRRGHVVPIDAVADVEALNTAIDEPGPERSVMARDELRRLQAAIEKLPPRCRQAVVMGRIEGLTGREIAARMGISEKTVSEHLSLGMCALADALYGEQARKE